MAEGWGSALGRITKWLDPLFDKRKRLDAQIERISRELEEMAGNRTPGTEHIAADLQRELSRLRAQRAKLKD